MYARVNAEAVLIDCLAQRPIWAARALETVAPQPKLNERNKIDVDLPPCANPRSERDVVPVASALFDASGNS